MSRSADGLRSVIGFWGGTAIVIGCTVGSGIFRAPGEIAQVLPDPPVILSLWLVMGLVSLCGALTLAELVCLFPHTGGTYVYLRAAYGDAAAFAFGWLYLIAAIPSGIGTLAMVFSERVMELLYGGAEDVPGLLVRGVAAGTIVVLSAANVIGVRFGASIQGFFTTIKVVALLALLVAAATVGQVDTANLAAQAAPRPANLAQAAAFVIFTYNGWVYISLVAGELSDARRQIKRTILVSMAVIIALYLAANLAYHLSLPADQVAREQVVARRLATDWLGPWGGAIMSACILASVFGTLNGIILTNARVPFALARSGLGFRALGRVHPRFATPHVAIGVQAAVAIALVFWLESFARLSTYFVLVEWSALVFAIAAIFILRPRAPTSTAYRTPGYPVVPLVFVAGAGSILVGIGISTWTTGDRAPVLGLLIAAAGLPLYHLWRRFTRPGPTSTASS
jgi:APA family basic amino acid/polyamine antiporter